MYPPTPTGSRLRAERTTEDQRTESHWVWWRLGLLVSKQCVVGLSGSVGRFELRRGDVAEVAVEALSISSASRTMLVRMCAATPAHVAT